MEEESEDQ
jgi:hypothetical protein